MMPNHNLYLRVKENAITGRYVINTQIINFLDDLSDEFVVETVGSSVQKRPIRSVTIGKGVHKILMWSQMHGNESTTTKAVLDLLKFLKSKESLASLILENCTLKIIPILNPDGAEVYTRVNANGVDLNRDAQARSQPESKVLRDVYGGFQPNFCFNLHDQRTIFNVGDTSKPATISFLAPSHDKERSISKTRETSMQLIAAMNQELQKLIPGQIGRYDDGFNANCVGDTFQILQTPTILFEAGHYPNDYGREKTREYIWHSLLTALNSICKGKIKQNSKKDYFEIPENNKLFLDVIIKNVDMINTSFPKNIGIIFSEILRNGKISFEAKIEIKENIDGYFGHRIFDCKEDYDLNALKKQSYWGLLQS